MSVDRNVEKANLSTRKAFSYADRCALESARSAYCGLLSVVSPLGKYMKSANRKRILMLVENQPFPQDPRVFREATTLADNRYQVSVIAQRYKKQPWYEKVHGISVYRYPAPISGNGLIGYLIEYGYSILASFVLSLVALVHRGFDVIHAHNPPDFYVVIAAFYKLFGKQFIFDHHDLAPEMYNALNGGRGNSLVHRMLVLFEQMSSRLADHVIVTNESYKKIQMARGGVPEDRITVVRNGPNLKRIHLVDPDAELQSRAKTIIGYVGDMGYHDGIDYLVRAVNHLVHDLKRADFFCVVIGTGDAWEEMKKYSHELGLEQYIWFTGYVSDEEMLRYLSSAHICVDPDPANPFTDRSSMIKMTEYMALQKAIVAFRLTEHQFTAQDAAIYADPNDELEFARCIERLMDDPERRLAMGEIGRRRIETALSWPHQAHALIDAYAALYPPNETAPAIRERKAAQ